MSLKSKDWEILLAQDYLYDNKKVSIKYQMHEKNSLSENCMESYNLYTIRSVNLER